MSPFERLWCRVVAFFVLAGVGVVALITAAIVVAIVVALRLT